MKQRRVNPLRPIVGPGPFTFQVNTFLQQSLAFFQTDRLPGPGKNCQASPSKDFSFRCLAPSQVVKAFHLNQSVELEAFHPPPFSSEEDRRLNSLCPVRPLRCYVSRMRTLCQSDQLFICHGVRTLDQALSKQRLSQ
ncbi:UNVERIFIED_CONTAM: hypothetical protein FKN15_046786 [Acipenser sinensis]